MDRSQVLEPRFQTSVRRVFKMAAGGQVARTAAFSVGRFVDRVRVKLQRGAWHQCDSSWHRRG